MNHRLDRFEMKFVISHDQRTRLMARLLPHLRADDHAGEGASYPIVSLYYDTPDRDCYWEKIMGTPSRRKLRVRVYGSRDGALPPTAFVEVKHKCDGRGVKRRVRLSLEQALRAAAGEPLDLHLGPMDQRTIEEVRRLAQGRGFRPCCCLRYDRQAFAGRDLASQLRITFDSGIAYRFDHLTPAPDDRPYTGLLIGRDCVVMEVKVADAVPFWLTRLLGEEGCMLQGFSKYCRALEAGDPSLHRAGSGTEKQVGAKAGACLAEAA